MKLLPKLLLLTSLSIASNLSFAAGPSQQDCSGSSNERLFITVVNFSKHSYMLNLGMYDTAYMPLENPGSANSSNVIVAPGAYNAPTTLFNLWEVCMPPNSLVTLNGINGAGIADTSFQTQQPNPIYGQIMFPNGNSQIGWFESGSGGSSYDTTNTVAVYQPASVNIAPDPNSPPCTPGVQGQGGPSSPNCPCTDWGYANTGWQLPNGTAYNIAPGGVVSSGSASALACIASGTSGDGNYWISVMIPPLSSPSTAAQTPY
ncbi:MAG: hypothetical protein K0Q57_25 [Gammaproteobacteria bacterium]|nr:hypothetical protein [Gammaproteobacteria bacterium]